MSIYASEPTTRVPLPKDEPHIWKLWLFLAVIALSLYLMLKGE